MKLTMVRPLNSGVFVNPLFTTIRGVKNISMSGVAEDTDERSRSECPLCLPFSGKLQNKIFPSTGMGGLAVADAHLMVSDWTKTPTDAATDANGPLPNTSHFVSAASPGIGRRIWSHVCPAFARTTKDPAEKCFSQHHYQTITI